MNIRDQIFSYKAKNFIQKKIIISIAFLGLGIALSAQAAPPSNNTALKNSDWPSHGLDAGESRNSSLRQITSDNADKLGLAWSYNLESGRGVEATPLVVNGIMYVTASWSVVHAIDARSGKRLWTYDPEVPRSYGVRACCDVVNRGVAFHNGNVFVGALDGRLISLNARTGKKTWEVDTRLSPEHPYTITGAPRIANGKVIIGNGGAEYGVRGYVTAYDTSTGKQAWRWFTIPGDPSKPFENAAMAKAATTWDPSSKYWEMGGGGTVWDSMAFDPELNLLYIGTGNGAPWSQKRRSPAGGDNLYLSSIVALNPDTGEYVWHYQETPGDNWDYTATQHIILADIELDGKKRKVLLHAPKNGFFFVLDRTNGQFISAKNYVEVNWASGYTADGRPIETPNSRPTKMAEIKPGPLGGHNWPPMSYNPSTGLVYIPAHVRPSLMGELPDWKYGVHQPGVIGSGTGVNLGVAYAGSSTKPYGRLIAWDPVAQKAVWQQDHVSHFNGGTLTTQGNLVFQGTADGRFIAWNAKTGSKVWESPVGLGIVAAPVTYALGGKQYVSIAAGWGGGVGLSTGVAPKVGPGTVFTFALGANTPLPQFADQTTAPLVQGVEYDPNLVAAGQNLYVSNCVACHGIPGADKGGTLPNLGRSHPDIIRHLDRMIFAGPYMSKGMPDFTGKLSNDDVEKIKAFIQGTADKLRSVSTQAPAKP